MRLSLVLCLSCAALCALAQDVTLTADNPDTTTPSVTNATTTSTTPIPTPTSSTPAPPTTAAPPTPPVSEMPAPISYEVKDGNNSCLLATFATQFNIPYNQTDNKQVTAYLNVNDGTVDPSTKCDWNATLLDLKINFDGADNMVLSFKKDGSKRWLHQLVLTYTPSNATVFPGHSDPTVQKKETFANLTLFEAEGEKSYFCADGKQTTSDGVTAKFGTVQVDAFRQADSGDKYREKQDCASEDVNDLVPIAVGIALLALVIIVLIAYFIGRRRSRRLAYQSV